MVIDPAAADPFDGESGAGVTAGGPSLLVVAAGYATAEQLADAVEVSAQRRLRLAGVVVANPDPADLSTGRGRAVTAPLHQRVLSGAVAQQ